MCRGCDPQDGSHCDDRPVASQDTQQNGCDHRAAYGVLLEQLRRRYAYATAEDPKNPWRQRQWIRFLITHGTLVEARAAWQHAIRSIDPEGTRLRNSPWLALNLHYWVARQWLAMGRLDDARAVLSEVPARWLAEETKLRELLQVLTAQEQSLTLGESVYPASTPVDARWNRPLGLRSVRSGRQLITWAPGRVVEALPTAVTVVVAPTAGEAQQLTFDAESWRRMTGEPAERAEGFFELGTYEGGDQIVQAVHDERRHQVKPEDLTDEMILECRRETFARWNMGEFVPRPGEPGETLAEQLAMETAALSADGGIIGPPNWPRVATGAGPKATSPQKERPTTDFGSIESCSQDQRLDLIPEPCR